MSITMMLGSHLSFWSEFTSCTLDAPKTLMLAGCRLDTAVVACRNVLCETWSCEHVLCVKPGPPCALLSLTAPHVLLHVNEGCKTYRVAARHAAAAMIAD
jgi:hypothetical protein